MGRKLGLVSGVLVLGMLFFGVIPVWADTINVPADYATIQEAINNASAGDTINVAAGTYNEHILIDKSNLNLIGEDKETTIVNARQNSSWSVAKAGILIGQYPLTGGVSGVTVRGFTIRDAALQEDGTPYGGNKYGSGPGGLAGIQIYNSSNNTIEGNILINNYWQIWIVAEWPAAGYTECKNNSIVNNIIRDSTRDGIYLYSDGGVSVENTLITGNDIYNVSGTGSSGIEFGGWPVGGPTPTIKNTVIQNNNISNCTWGIAITSNVYDARGTKIKNNRISNCTKGIRISDKEVEDITGIEIKENNITGNIVGVENYYSPWWGFYGEVRTTIDATNNWWGDTDRSGPKQVTTNPGGTGDEVSDDVNYDPWIGKPDNTNTDVLPDLPDGNTGTLTPGENEIEVKNISGTPINVSAVETDTCEQGFTGMGGGLGLDRSLVITSTATTASDVVAVVKFHYTQAELTTLGISAQMLRLYCWDAAQDTWVAVGTIDCGLSAPPTLVDLTENDVGKYGVDTGNKYVWAVVDHFSIFGGGLASIIPPVCPVCSSSDDRCFIATAAFGTPMAEEVRDLRKFRDEELLTNALGRGFVKFYYKTSPPIADFIRNKPALRAMVRVGLKPLVWFSRLGK